MYTVFDPSMLWISETDWQDEEKRLQFLDHLLQNLTYIDDYRITRIYWTETFEHLLWSAPQLPPWRKSRDWKIKIIPVINRRLQRNLKWIKCPGDLHECKVEPAMTYSYGKTEINTHFMELMHLMIIQKENVYLCLGVENQLPQNTNGYIFSCQCHQKQIIPLLINVPDDWLKFVDLEDEYWPSSIDEIDKFDKAVKIMARVKLDRNNFLHEYEYTKPFIKDIIKVKNHKEQILFSIAKRLSIRQDVASSDKGLNDKSVRGKEKEGERRFRVTEENRIHYKYGYNGSIIFLRYYADGQHDKGL